ncbi:MAG: hypothetical protein J0L87_04595 [Bacteroidetes bacterium]|nr:hypothetical protein [Bacteroidota bacterium]
MAIRHYKIVFILFALLVSCESETATNKTKEKVGEIKVDSSKLSYVSSVYDKAPALFKKNCAECHCSPSSNCESPNEFRLKEYFKNISDKSLLEVLRKLKDSSSIESNDNKIYNHNLGEEINDEQLKIIVEYLRIESKR